jgi:hypothetical protein
LVSFTPRPLYRREKASGTHSIGRWVGPRVGLDAVAKRKRERPCPYITNGKSVIREKPSVIELKMEVWRGGKIVQIKLMKTDE